MNKKALAVTLYALFSVCIFAQENVLTIEEYVKLIKIRLPELVINESKVISAQNAVLQAKGAFDIGLNAQTGANGAYGDYYSSAAAGMIGNTNGFNLGIGGNGIIPALGMRINVDVSQDLTVISKLNGTVYNPAVSLTISQPLLYNVLGTLDRYPLKDAQTALAIARIQRRLNDSSVISEFQRKYIQWIMLEKMVQMLKTAVKEAETFENQIQRRVQSGLAENDSFLNAKQQSLQYKTKLRENEEKLSMLKNTIDFFVPIQDKIPALDSWNPLIEIAKKEKFPFVPFEKTVYFNLTEELKNRMRGALEVSKNGTLPQLMLFGTVSAGGNGLSGNYFDTFGKVNNIHYFAGLKFSYPLGNNTAKAKLLEAQNNLKSIVAECEKTQNNYIVQAKGIIANYELYKELLENNLIQIELVSGRLEIQFKRLSQGRQEVDEIIRTRLEQLELEIAKLNLEYGIVTSGFDYISLLALNDFTATAQMK